MVRSCRFHQVQFAVLLYDMLYGEAISKMPSLWAAGGTKGSTMRFAGKIALVTGGYRGMGGESSKAMAREGATVIAVDIIPGEPADAAAGVVHRQLDVTSAEQWTELARW